MDDRQGNVYASRTAALSAGVPDDHVQEVEVFDAELLRVTSGPMRGRIYKRTATGLQRLHDLERAESLSAARLKETP